MEHLLREARGLFGVGPVPGIDGLVSWDGFDQLEKESAVRFYSGMSWEDVLRHLRNSGSYELEEWSVLQEPSLSYYGRAHLEYLFDTVTSNAPDEGFVSQFFHQLYQLVYMHGESPFTVPRTSLLLSIARAIPDYAIERGLDRLVDDYVLHNIELYLRELGHGS